MRFRFGKQATMLTLAATFAVLPAARNWAAPLEALPGRSAVVDCADSDQFLTRGIRVAPSVQAPREPALLSVRVLHTSGPAGPRALCPGATLASGDQLRVAVWVGRPLYIYVFSTRPDGTIEPLYPTHGRSAFVDSEREVTLPQGGEAFELDDALGTETFWVVGSSQRLSADNGSLNDVARTLGTERRPAPPVARTTVAKSTARPRAAASAAKTGAPTNSDLAWLTTRGLVVKKDVNTLEAVSADKDGVVSAPFWLKHVARR